MVPNDDCAASQKRTKTEGTENRCSCVNKKGQVKKRSEEEKKKRPPETGSEESVYEYIVISVSSEISIPRPWAFREIIREVTKRSYENVVRTLNTRKHVVVEMGNAIDTWKISQV